MSCLKLLAAVLTFFHPATAQSVSLSSSEGTFLQERSVPYQVCVDLFGSPSDGDLTVFITSSGTSATTPEDFQLSNTALVFMDGTNELQQCINLTIVDDYLVEQTEFFSLMATASSGTTDSLLFLISNNDNALIGLDRESYTVNEADGSVTVCVVFLMNSGIQDSTLSADATLAAADGTAIAVEDYGQPMPSSITLTSTTPASGACSTINIPQDAIEEGREMFSVTVTAGARAQVVDGRGTAQVLIVDGCGSLPPPENGNVDASTTTVGSVATYSCSNGFLISGDSQRNCQMDGFWSGSAPTCSAIGNPTCPTFEQRELAQQVVTASFNDFSILAVNTKPNDSAEPSKPIETTKSTQTSQSVEPPGTNNHPCGPGNWTQVILLNLSNPSHQCPSAWTEVTTAAGRACTRPGTNSGSCPSAMFPTFGLQYNRICGGSVGYQNGTTDAFLNSIPQTIDSFYVDGVSITHGLPRQHIWSFASGLTESPESGTNGCFCGDPNITPGAPPPAFVGTNYFCESGNSGLSRSGVIFTEDPLWDGMDCPTNNCCEFNNPPWFNTELSTSTTDDIEVRLCCNQDTDDENILLQLLELYVSYQETP